MFVKVFVFNGDGSVFDILRYAGEGNWGASIFGVYFKKKFLISI